MTDQVVVFKHSFPYLLIALTPIFPIFSATQEDIITSSRGNTEPLQASFGRLKYFSVHFLVLIKALKICLKLSGYHFCFHNQVQIQKQGKLGFTILALWLQFCKRLCAGVPTMVKSPSHSSVIFIFPH